MFNSILVVCTGNICRSPIGERYLKQGLSGKHVASAGTGALVGHAADESAFRVAEKNGLSLDGHVGQQFTAELARKYDLILVMEKYHLDKICHISPELRGKTMLYGHWIDRREIPDPYKKSDEAFDSVYELIKRAGQCWIDKLSS